MQLELFEPATFVNAAMNRKSGMTHACDDRGVSACKTITFDRFAKRNAKEIDCRRCRVAIGLPPLAASTPPLHLQPTPAPIGSGPTGETCGSCVFCNAKGGVAGRYLKCYQTDGAWDQGKATDIKAKWPACSEWFPRRGTVAAVVLFAPANDWRYVVCRAGRIARLALMAPENVVAMLWSPSTEGSESILEPPKVPESMVETMVWFDYFQEQGWFPLKLPQSKYPVVKAGPPEPLANADLAAEIRQIQEGDPPF